MSLPKFHPAIVVVAYNRAESLARILDSIHRSKIPPNTELVISIDNGSNTIIEDLAETFEWVHGTKRVISHTYHLGLREHILRCGDLTEEYGSIILLEDDLFVSPHFFQYSMEALSFYCDAKNIGGISLYNHQYNEYAHFPFEPIFDGHDNYFLQIASSWGQAWTHTQWSAFRSWYGESKVIQEEEKIPHAVKLWPESSWKKYYISYLVEENKYFVYPRVSLTTNFCEPGTHNIINNTLQVPLAIGEMKYSFSIVEDSIAVYDSYCELEPEKLKKIVPELREYDFECDLYGLKELRLIQSKYILSSKTHHSIGDSHIPIVDSFGLRMKPMELNVIYNVQGDFFKLLEINSTLVQLEFQIDRGALFQYFYTEKKFIPTDIISQEVSRIHGSKLILEVMNKAKNRIRKVFQ